MVKRLFVGCVVCLLLLCVAYFALRMPPGTGDYAHGLHTRILFKNLEVALRKYAEDYGMFPTGDISDVVKVLRAQNRDGQNERRVLYFEPQKRLVAGDGRLLDEWRTPIRLARSQDGKSLTLKSLGKNKKEDGGADDDITITIQK